MKSKSTIRSILTHHCQNPTESTSTWIFTAVKTSNLAIPMCQIQSFVQVRDTAAPLCSWCPLDLKHISYEGVSKCFRTESITKYTPTTINTRGEATQSVMIVNLTRLTHKIAIQLHLVAESCTICSSYSRRPVRKRLDTPSCLLISITQGVFSRSCWVSPSATVRSYVPASYSMGTGGFSPGVKAAGVWSSPLISIRGWG
jgi:hypothetical protein